MSNPGVLSTIFPDPPDHNHLAVKFAAAASHCDPSNPKAITELVDVILKQAVVAGASDIHFVIQSDELQILWRIDGVLQKIATYPKALAANFVARLKVLAELLTYRTDVPQEGRLNQAPAHVEMRLSTFPTLYGEKAVVRIFAHSGQFRWPDELGLPEDVQQELLRLIHETTGAVLIAGPAGSGKTTTAYACLRELQREHGVGKSIVSLEDPIESVLSGVSQSHVNRTAGFDYATGLRSLMRQDPDVILVGEIRDQETAETVIQACLTGHLVISTFHAGTACEAISRLSDMGIEPYLLRTGLRAVVCLRLFRQLCDCAEWTVDDAAKYGFTLPKVRIPVGCEHCSGTGYRGRMVLAEILSPESAEVGRAILNRQDASEIHRIAVQQGMVSVAQRAVAALADGRTSPIEVRRILGFRTTVTGAFC